ncbi:cholesterol 25-hydroxylase-like isoform X1 [Pomacea canaliculata]|nr:cholesterol 25-hydroxylase-like isoform X1 [Pomacea canaliculata]
MGREKYPPLNSHEPLSRQGKTVVALVRVCVLLSILACVVWRDIIQSCINVTWSYLLTTWWFNTVYFETGWATLIYAIIISVYPFALHFIRWFDRFKVHPSVTYIHQPFLGILKDVVWYMAPLALLDTVIVKKYNGVDPTLWRTKELAWIQTTRALPAAPPSVGQLFFQVIGSVLIYDAMFFFIHLMLHKHRKLYLLLHERHHVQDVMHAHVTNQLSMGERVTLVLAANQALKILFSHPLSRAVFVPVFIWLLVDNHSGYDFPWGLQHVVPGGLMGGARAHYAHHMHGTRHYQPFFTYLDKALVWREGGTSHFQKSGN